MRVPVEWISEYVDIQAPIDELADLLTMAGLEVEEIQAISPDDLARSGGVPDSRDARVMLTKVTPNRGDWLSMIGVAREIAANTGWKFKLPEPQVEGAGADVAGQIKISIADPDLCNRYVGMVIRGVQIKESPTWLKNRLVMAGMRPINNIVDITNYVMLELGQPLHAFDYDLVQGHEIIVRRAKEGEKITSIDQAERELRPDTLVIADAGRAVAIAGVMGGFESEVTHTTTNILLESANFDAVSIRRTSKVLGLVTESSYRFERGVDPEIAALAAPRAAELMAELAGGEIASGMVDVYPGKKEPKKIVVRPERVDALLGEHIDPAAAVSHLIALQIPAEFLDGKIVATAPSFRSDIAIEVDIIEEIARIHGYENILETLPSFPLQGKDSDAGLFVEELRQAMMAAGMQEVLTHSVVDPVSVELSGYGEKILPLKNPLSEDVSRMRPMLAPNLLQVITRNQAVGAKDISIFEIGKVYRRTDTGGIYEYRSAAGAMVGSQWASAWSINRDTLAADFFLTKGALIGALTRIGVKNITVEPAEHPLLHPTRSARVLVDGEEIGILGEASPEAREKLDLRGRPCVFEFDVEKLMGLVPVTVGYKQLPRFPAIHRHIGVVLKRDLPYVDVLGNIRQSGGEIIEGVELLDVYTGSQVGADEKSFTLSLVFRSPERTLTDDEVNGVLESVKTRLASTFEASFRG